MVDIEFLGPIDRKNISLDVSTLDEVSLKLQNDKELSDWLEKCAIAVNDEIVFNRDIKLKDGDKISLLPPVCGG